ncbi:MAG: phage holin family protein [Deltaproteobacteria bacterium]|nr:phage holin family protein [Deltaproteobacteria bacterium]MBW2361086.1 phage holin family protein [Deltaproteobacteria bacterium]
MTGFLIRLVISAMGLWIAARVVPGVEIRGEATLLLAALLLGIVNAVVRPVVVLLTLPVTLLTLGLFLWVVNAAMFGLVAALIDGFHVAGFGSALLGSLLVSVTSWFASSWVAPSGRVEVIQVHGRTH